MAEWMGWLATAVFASSYFFKGARQLRYVQALAAGLWIVYGSLLKAYPVVVSNMLVAILVAWTAWLGPRVARRRVRNENE